MVLQGKMRKAAVLLLAMIVAAVYMPFAGEVYGETINFTDGDFTYTMYDDTGAGEGSLWLTGYGGTATEISVPLTATYSATGITYGPPKAALLVGKDAFDSVKNTLKKVAVQSGTEGLVGDSEGGTFAGFTALTAVAIGEGVNYIGQNVFSGCPNLKSYYMANTKLEGGGDPGIGKAADGTVYEGVTVYIKTGTNDPNTNDVVKYVNTVNAASTGYKITIQEVDDPYSMIGIATDNKNTDDNNNNTSTGNDNNNNSNSSNNTAGSDSGTTDNTSNTNTDTKASKTTAQREKQMGVDGTAFGKGAAEEAVTKALLKTKVSAREKDPKGALYNGLQAKVIKLTAKSVKVQWKKVKGAKKYVIYGNRCGKENKMLKQKTINKTSYTFKKVNKKAVRKGTYYKFIVVALDKNNNVISTSKMVHGATPGGKVGNDKAVKTAAKNNKVRLKIKKKFNLKAKAVVANKKLKVNRHRGIAYESTNSKVASVSSKGVIKAKKKGTCYVYAYAQNGVSAKIKVIVTK